MDSLIKTLNETEWSKKEEAILLETISFYHPKLDSALYFAKKSLKLSKELNDPILKAEALEGIALIEQRLGNDTQSLEATFEALTVYEKLNLVERQAALQTQIATYYIGEEEYVLAINYLEKAFEIYEASDNNINKALTLINLGESYRLSNKINQAEEAFDKVLQLNEKLDNDVILGYSLGNLGIVYSDKGEIGKSKEALNKAIKILTELNDDYSVSIYLSELGLIYKDENNYDLAESKLIEAYKMAEKAGLKEQIRDFSALLVNLYETKRDYQKALIYQKVYQIYQDSLVNKINIKKIEQLKAGYEINQRESEIKRINEISNNRKNIAFGLAFGIFSLAVLMFLLYKAYKKIRIVNKDLSKQKKDISEREQEKALLLKELNHRVKNNLQMISSLLNLQSSTITDDSAKEVIALGKNRVEALSLVHRKLYQEGLETKVEVKTYVEELILNLLHGYATQLEPEFDISPVSISVDKAIPLALIINELVTNAIKHAYIDIVDPKLKIVIHHQYDYFNLEIIDNGKGFDQKERDKTNSLGLKLVLSLIKQLEGTCNTIINGGTHWVIKLKIDVK
ncbi:histidine kinase dimerization/phosphoacceptor domain -containing protein [uncultured Psychroserpens sp.]|uniref:sensor histidine kinase n=1 Tax=uncultured Psychroserpens sp. TaxID=255436 RepID=UPI002609A33A|nr:histidine kinase dimerization/phosphoacceptor domain -containing protein [uncultured Psychroserpens sp.]